MQPFAPPSPYIEGPEPDGVNTVENPVSLPQDPPEITPGGDEKKPA